MNLLRKNQLATQFYFPLLVHILNMPCAVTGIVLFVDICNAQVKKKPVKLFLTRKINAVSRMMVGILYMINVDMVFLEMYVVDK